MHVSRLDPNMPSFGKRIPLMRSHFQKFELAYGDDTNGESQRVDLGELGRWRCFTREAIAKRGENLDITWLRDESLHSGDDMPEPEVIAVEIMVARLYLSSATQEVNGQDWQTT